ncbi:ABC transporter permease, partial [Gemmatimonadota bacterium]
MTWFRSMHERLRALFGKARLDAEMDEELRFHLEMEMEKNRRAGMTFREARRHALVAFGGVDRFREKTREERGMSMVDDLIGDLRFAFRTLRKSPGLVVVTVLSLGLGIAVSSTVFSVAVSLLLGDPGPMGNPQEVVAVYTSDDEGSLYDETSYLDYVDMESGLETLEALAAHRLGVLTLGDPENRERLIVELVTGNYFQVLQVTPVLGRGFLPEETVTGAAERLLVLSHRAWLERFGGDRGVLGETVELDGEPFTIIGVAPKGLVARYMKMDVDGWVPLGLPGGVYRVTPALLADRDSRQFFTLGRLAQGRTAEEAQAEASLLATRLQAGYPESWQDMRGQPRVLTVVPEAQSRVPPPARIALLGTAGFLLGGALLILLLACSNVASLLLARAHRRSREMAVRISLGAGRGRLLRMLLAESLFLSTAGGGLGLYLTYLATGYMQAVPLPFDVPLRFDFSMDVRVVVFTLILALGASLAAGLGPALQGSRAGLVPALKNDGGRIGGRRRRVTLRSLLVVGQVAAATCLVVGAGLAMRSVQASATYDLGLDASEVAVVWREPPQEELSPEDLRTHFLEVAARVEAHPEVESVALARTAEAYFVMEDFATALVERAGEEPLRIRFNAVTPGYMEMLGIPLVLGRSIGSGDGPGGPTVAVVNQTFVDRFFPESQGVGESFRVST